jgi:hypothetical protein
MTDDLEWSTKRQKWVSKYDVPIKTQEDIDREILINIAPILKKRKKKTKKTTTKRKIKGCGCK